MPVRGAARELCLQSVSPNEGPYMRPVQDIASQRVAGTETLVRFVGISGALPPRLLYGHLLMYVAQTRWYEVLSVPRAALAMPQGEAALRRELRAGAEATAMRNTHTQTRTYGHVHAFQFSVL